MQQRARARWPRQMRIYSSVARLVVVAGVMSFGSDLANLSGLTHTLCDRGSERPAPRPILPGTLRSLTGASASLRNAWCNSTKKRRAPAGPAEGGRARCGVRLDART